MTEELVRKTVSSSHNCAHYFNVSTGLYFVHEKGSTLYKRKKCWFLSNNNSIPKINSEK